MAEITGSNTSIILKQGSTHGTAAQGGAGDKLVLGIDGSLTQSPTITKLEHGGIGSGLGMKKNVFRGKAEWNLSLSNFVAGYDNNFDTILGIFMGVAGSPTEQNVGEGDYLHRITYSPSVKKFCTIAFEGTDSNVFEYPSCYPTSLSLSTGNPNGFLTLNAEFMADQRKITGTENTNAELDAATVASEEIIVHNQGDEFWINTQADGALDSGDRVNITSLTLDLTDAKAVTDEFKGTNINSVPDRTEMLMATLTVELKTLADFTWFTANDAETAYKCKFFIEGTQIASGDNHSFALYIPSMKLIDSPSYDLTSTGINPLTLTFDCLVAASAPTGMNSIYPYFEIINTNSSALIS